MVSIYVTLLNSYNELSLWVASDSERGATAEKPKAVQELLPLEVKVLAGIRFQKY